MRGKHCDAAGCTDDCRITPADAGKTRAVSVSVVKAEDHPRGCGENCL